MPRKAGGHRHQPDSSAAASDSRPKWRKRKREVKQAARDSDSEADDEEPAADDEEGVGAGGAGETPDPVLDIREAEVLLDGGQLVSDFPAACRRAVSRPHHSVLAIIAAERAASSGSAAASSRATLIENISHGQLQALSAVLPDHPSLLPASAPEPEKAPAFVCTPPALIEGRGFPKHFTSNQLLIVPKHSDWFWPNTVHRTERQVVPHFFSGKSPGNTPEKYIALRNKIISRYLENPGRRLAFADCQGMVTSNNELYDLSRIVRFLDNWGIINYLAIGSVHRGLRMAASLLREEPTGELQLLTAPLKSIDSLILFDRPKCSIRAEDVSLLSSSPSTVLNDMDSRLAELDSRIRERFLDSSCSYCSQHLSGLHYQSQKDADIALCSDCFNDAKYITGHASLDFVRADSKSTTIESDGDTWTDQETLLLLEGIEKYSDNWNEIAEHVGSKSKAQCIHHFIRLPVEDGLLENIQLPGAHASSKLQNGDLLLSHTNDFNSGSGSHGLSPSNQLPFLNSPNPVMTLVAFLASAIGPRVAASCAHAALCFLTKDDPRSTAENIHTESHKQRLPNIDGPSKDQPACFRNNCDSPVSVDRVRQAAACGLSAAAMKAKLFADQEEREIQRLAATIINHQLKRLELKLKQFAEIETLLLKECDQVEKVRQRLAAERVRMMSARLGAPGTSHPNTTIVNPSNASPRQSVVPSSSQASMQAAASAFGSGVQGQSQMAFMQRQQMLSFGPRLPLSAIHPQSAPGPNIMFSSGLPNSMNSNHHQL